MANGAKGWAFFRRLRQLQYRATRRMMFAWIKPTILGCDPASLAVDDADFVCYVLPFRSISDLMVIDKACENAGLPRPINPMQDELEDRSFFFLGRPEGRLGRKSQRQQSARMQRLFDHQQQLSQPLKVVPVSLFWGHQPDQEKSLFKLIFSENWAATSRFKKLMAIIFHPHHILVQFSQPVLLTDIMTEQSDRELQIRKLMRLLRVHFNHQKQAILGPDLSHRRTLINSMMESSEVRDAIRLETESSGNNIASIEKRALSYANEIASDQSYRVIRFFHVLLTWLWNKLYDGIDIYNIERAKELARSAEIVYTPCHRSHIDYLLLSYVLYHNGLTPPHIAAGINLNLPVAGPLLRRAGAFFMRRSFRGDALYKAVFDEYLHLMFTRGYSVEYFIEGGRSRTGRTLVPRTGMLSMTMRSFQRDASRPMVLMPVYFSYERVIEASTYMGELAGKDKKKESLLDLLKVFGIFRHAFGKVAVNFGEPIIMQDFLSAELPGWQSGNENTDGFSQACVTLSRRLAANINGAAVVNPVNLVATALLATSRQTMTEDRLLRQVESLRTLARQLPGYGDIVVTGLATNEILAEAERVAGIERQPQPFGDIIACDAHLAILLTWYRNNTAHLFALPSLIARIVRTREKVTRQRLVDACVVLYPYLQAEYFLKWQPETFADACHALLDEMAGMSLVSLQDEYAAAPPPASEAYACLAELGEIIEPTLERFYLVTSLVQTAADRSIDAIEADAARIARELSTIYSINSPEFFEQSLFANFIAALRSHGLIHVMESRVTPDDERFMPVHIAAESTLSPDVRYNLLQAIGRLERDTAAV